MRNTLYSLVVISLLTTNVFSQTTHKQISLSFDKGDFTILCHDSILSFASSRHMLRYDTNLDEPELPYVTIAVLISPNDEFCNVTCSTKDCFITQGGYLKPNPRLLPTTNKRDSFSIQKNNSYEKLIYPVNIIRFTGVRNAGGYKYLCFAVFPFLYRSDVKSLSLHEEISLDIELKKNKLIGKKPSILFDEDWVKHLVINSDELSSLYPSSNRTNQKNNTNTRTNDSFDYLILTVDSFKNAFQELAHWKTMKGVKTRVVTIDSLMANYPTDMGECLALKKFIRNYRDNYHVKYVLLGGDTEFIPAQMCYIKIYDNAVNYTPCDLYYACFDDVNDQIDNDDWDYTSNHQIGEIDDRVDLIPTIWLTRLSVNSYSDALNQVQRIINYESNPRKFWKNKVLMAGNKLYNYHIIDDRNTSDAELFGELIYEDAINSHMNRYRLYDTWTDHANGANYQLNRSHLKTALDSGYPFVHMECHGNIDQWALETDTFKIQDALSIDNSFYTIIITPSCHTNAIDVPRCLSEAFMRNYEGGILGYFGSSREGWCSNGDELDGSDLFTKSYFLNLFDEGNREKHFGQIATQAKTDNTHGPMDYTDPCRWLHFSMNILGDPEMPVFIAKPKKFIGIEYGINNGDLDDLYIDIPSSYRTGPDTCRVCIMSLSDDGESYYERCIARGSANCHYELPPVSCSVCITKPGYVPFTFIVNRDGYIQNETLETENRLYIADVLNIGRNVTSEKPYGPVTIQSGSVDFIGINKVYIKNDFEVKKGATLNINPKEE